MEAQNSIFTRVITTPPSGVSRICLMQGQIDVAGSPLTTAPALILHHYAIAKLQAMFQEIKSKMRMGMAEWLLSTC